MHVAHEVVHMIHGLLAGLDHEIDALVKHVQIEVGRHYGHFDEFVAAEDIQAGHLAVDPDQGVFQCFHVLHGSALLAIRSGGALGGVATTTLEGYWKEHPCPLVLT